MKEIIKSFLLCLFERFFCFLHNIGAFPILSQLFRQNSFLVWFAANFKSLENYHKIYPWRSSIFFLFSPLFLFFQFIRMAHLKTDGKVMLLNADMFNMRGWVRKYKLILNILSWWHRRRSTGTSSSWKTSWGRALTVVYSCDDSGLPRRAGWHQEGMRCESAGEEPQ